jgi:hypothetical protein
MDKRVICRRNAGSLCKRRDKGGYQIRNLAAIHFVTFSVVEWVDVFTRRK